MEMLKCPKCGGEMKLVYQRWRHWIYRCKKCDYKEDG